VMAVKTVVALVAVEAAAEVGAGEDKHVNNNATNMPPAHRQYIRNQNQ